MQEIWFRIARFPWEEDPMQIRGWWFEGEKIVIGNLFE